MRENINVDDLTVKIKNHIGITWDYQDGEVRDMIEDGLSKIETISPSTDFSEGLGWKILKAYCRYAWDGSEAYFEENYKRDLLQLQIQNFAKNNEATP